jgi:hypothetical protein
MNKELKIESRLEWMALYSLLSRKQREIENAFKLHESGEKKLDTVQLIDCENMLLCVKNMLERM